MIPPFLLAKLYVKGSLKNTSDGFEFSFKNFIEATLLTGLGPIVAGESTYEGAAIQAKVGEETWSGADVSPQNPIPARVNVPIHLRVIGVSLPPGEQRIFVHAVSSDIGALRFEVKERLDG